jgi:hypothetical protein
MAACKPGGNPSKTARKCEQESRNTSKTYSREGKIHNLINVLQKNGAPRKFFACNLPFATAQRTGLSGILS